MKWVKRIAALAGALAASWGMLLIFPQPLFEHRLDHDRYRVHSDRPIAPEVRPILDEVTRRLRRSDLFDPAARFAIYICNDRWRLWLFTRSTQIGGSAEAVMSGNIYLREADIAADRLIPPEGVLADGDVRTLTYFIAHEAVHILEGRAFGRLAAFRYPRWLTDGYADLIAKAGRFDFAENRRLLRHGDPRLDYDRSGLYRRYHLMVAFLVEERGIAIRALYADPPDEARVLQALTRPGPV